MRKLGVRGVVALEVALVAPMIPMAVALALEGGFMAATSMALEFGARRASRVGITGAADNTGNVADNAARMAEVTRAVIAGSGGMLAADKLVVNATSFNSVAQAASGASGSGNVGTAGQLVRYTLTYSQPMVASLFMNLSPIPHNATVLVKNEPFSSK